MIDETTFEAVPRATIKGFDRVLQIRTVGDHDPVRLVTTIAYTKGMLNAQMVARALQMQRERDASETPTVS